MDQHGGPRTDRHSLSCSQNVQEEHLNEPDDDAAPKEAPQQDGAAEAMEVDQEQLPDQAPQ